MIRKSLISLIYEAASIQRWNDHIRPWSGFSELDKQAHKLFYAYILAKCEGEFDGLKLIEGGIFEFLHRVILTDIKPPIYHSLMEKKGGQINRWVMSQLKSRIDGLKGGFADKMTEYYENADYAKKEKQILKAAHYYATNWEFEIIYHLNQTTYGIEETKANVTKGLAACDTFAGFRYFAGSPYLKDFLSLIGQLRYQQRWSRTARLPQTFVMGHMLVVAMLSYFCSLEADACDKRLVNNFFGGLFHDLPEVLTRDIVSPVKASVEGLEDIIKDIEDSQMKEIIYPLLPPPLHDEIVYFTQDEFASKIRLDGKITKLSSEEISKSYNCDKYCPIDGEIIRGCDHLSAYIEAYLSIHYGIVSEQLKSGHADLFARYENKNIAGVDFGQLFDYFRI
ncbi:MAG: HD domain-containing protein [Clostridia bacterium]|nr:HD domain-containing protein [Clostridia bacterium]